MSVTDVFYYTATVILIVTSVVMVFLAWRIYITLNSLEELLLTTQDTLLEIRNTPKRIQNNIASSALGLARFIWGRG